MRLALILCLLIPLGGCLEMKVHEEIVQTAISPNGHWKATTVLIDGGATTSRGHVVWLTAAAETNYKKGERIFDADHCYKATADWSENGSLRIRSDGKVLILVTVYFDINIEHVPIKE